MLIIFFNNFMMNRESFIEEVKSDEERDQVVNRKGPVF
jgi:hypothetical protein